MAQMGKGGAVANESQAQYLTFELSGELFGIAILGVKEIIEYGGLTVVPMMPPSVRGVINLRGAVVPVVDLSVRFGGGASSTSRRTCIVIVEHEYAGERFVIGVVVDAVNEVLEVPTDQIEPAPTFGTRVRSDFISGMGKVGDRFVILLNVSTVLSFDELASTPEWDEGARLEVHENEC